MKRTRVLTLSFGVAASCVKLPCDLEDLEDLDDSDDPDFGALGGTLESV